MTYGTNIIKDGKVIRTSRNLRGMRDYARVSSVVAVTTKRDPANKERGILKVRYQDGAYSVANFASHAIMIDFVRNRRSWRGATINHVDGDMGYLTKPGIIARETA